MSVALKKLYDRTLYSIEFISVASVKQARSVRCSSRDCSNNWNNFFISASIDFILVLSVIGMVNESTNLVE